MGSDTRLLGSVVMLSALNATLLRSMTLFWIPMFCLLDPSGHGMELVFLTYIMLFSGKKDPLTVFLGIVKVFHCEICF